MSSGYDSGAIACELTKQNVKFTAYSIANIEDKEVLNERAKIIKDCKIINLERESFLGARNFLKKNAEEYKFNIDNGERYRMHIFYLKYDPQLPHYYNNNQRFLQKNLDPTILETSKIFEKEEIRWISVNEMMKMRSKFRNYFQEIVDEIYKNENEIISFLNKKSHIKIKTQKTRRG